MLQKILIVVFLLLVILGLAYFIRPYEWTKQGAGNCIASDLYDEKGWCLGTTPIIQNRTEETHSCIVISSGTLCKGIKLRVVYTGIVE